MLDPRRCSGYVVKKNLNKTIKFYMGCNLFKCVDYSSFKTCYILTKVDYDVPNETLIIDISFPEITITSI